MYIAIDQYGQTYQNLQHPRKDLLNRLGRSHAENMYIDTKSGDTKHSGYVIAGLWLTIYKLSDWKSNP